MTWVHVVHLDSKQNTPPECITLLHLKSYLVAAAIPGPVSAGSGWPLVGSCGELLTLVPDQPGYHRSYLCHIWPSLEEASLSYTSNDFRGTYMGAHFALTGCELVDVHSIDLWMKRRNKLWVTQQGHSGPPSMRLWLQDLFISHKRCKGVSCLWGMGTNRRNKSTLSNLQKCTRVRAQNQIKPPLLTGTISLLIIPTCKKTPQDKATFFSPQIGLFLL